MNEAIYNVWYKPKQLKVKFEIALKVYSRLLLIVAVTTLLLLFTKTEYVSSANHLQEKIEFALQILFFVSNFITIIFWIVATARITLRHIILKIIELIEN